VSQFKGFGEKALAFLKALDFHQDRDWFKANRDLYESELETPRGDLIETLTARFAKDAIPFKGDRKKSTYRIYRDIRFSKDKRPFNRHVSALLTRSGNKNEAEPCFFIHVGLDACFMAVACYMPPPELLKAFRNSIAHRPEKFRAMTAALKKAKLELGTDGALKRLPQGFESVTDPDLAAAVKLKHFYVREDIDPKRVTSPKLVDDCASFAKRAMPLVEWTTAAGA
jgi:uncharacterized protein (TIGR02453 family)